MESREKRIRVLAEIFVNNLNDTEQQTLSVLLNSSGSEGLRALEDYLLNAISDQLRIAKEQLADFPDCEKCQGLGHVKRILNKIKVKEVTCSKCKGLGKFDPLFPNMAIALDAEADMLFTLLHGHTDPWEKYTYLESELGQQLQIVSKEKD